MGLVQSVTIPAPIDIIILCRAFALPFDTLSLLRYQTADFFLTVCHCFFHPLSIRSTARACALAQLRRGLAGCCRACCAAAAPRSATAAGRSQARRTAGIRPPVKGLSGLFFVRATHRITSLLLYANGSDVKVHLRIITVMRIKQAGG